MTHEHTDSAGWREGELFELDAGGRLRDVHGAAPVKYSDGSSIDWFAEEAHARARTQMLHSQHGIRGFLLPAMEAAWMWLVVILTGVSIGVAGAWLDVLVKWLADLREGRCTYGFFYNQPACCSGLDPGELCTEWKSWSEFFGVRYIWAQAMLQSTIYVALAIVFAASAAILVQSYAPYAFHTGIPEIKAILSGYVLDAFLTPWTLVIKALGLALSVASGLVLGKEGPLVHVACCIASMLSRMFSQFKNNEAEKRKMLAAAAAAGVSVAFGSPLGGVLFGLEELDTFAKEFDVMWRGFVASAVAAVALQYVDPFGTSKLVLFQVTSSSVTWGRFELIPWLALGVIGGVLGSVLIKLNVQVALLRRYSLIQEYPVLEVIGVSAVTASVSFLLVANLFQECDPSRGDYHGLCNPTALWENVFLLLDLRHDGPAGIFMPTIAIGACLGRAIGLIMQSFQRSYPEAWLFESCSPDPTIRCISPGFYAVVGAAAMLGGLTGALSHVLPIMVAVMTAKMVGDALGSDGIYPVWIALRRYPWLPPVYFKDKGATGASFMRNVDDVVVLEDMEHTLDELERLTTSNTFNGFPVLKNGKLIGYVTRDRLQVAVKGGGARKAYFSTADWNPEAAEQAVDLTTSLEPSMLFLRRDTPQEVVISMFQKLNIRRILFTQAGGLFAGMVTKSDIVALLNKHFPHAGALAERT
ncbi:chloride channel [Schizophyllum amplum]|uniref:Chloride channel protein n=1 Tax=Schizophyllum amplum TaxID=97359 RepID=A0A550C7F9_9AGAR|nr:chloride channel [Auriculariopsis ampla]